MTASYRVSPGGGIEGCSGLYTSRPKDRLFAKRSAGWYLIDFARSRHTNPARIPVIVNADWYYSRNGEGMYERLTDQLFLRVDETDEAEAREVCMRFAEELAGTAPGYWQ
jgi:hypothetical protein